MQPDIAAEIRRYLLTGSSDPLCAAWEGDIFERGHRAHRDLRRALLDEVWRLAGDRTESALPEIDLVHFTRKKVGPMVRGLFPRGEQDAVLRTLERSVVFLTAGNIEQVLVNESWDHTAWVLANLYLASLGAPLSAGDAPEVVGMSQETTCYVSVEYFDEEDPFADFLVHEAAHVFHNTKRATIGLPETRRREWLLDLAFSQRETFAYSCEAFSRIVERANDAADRRALADEFARTVDVPDDRVDGAEVADIVREAAAARNGWKAILSRCTPIHECSLTTSRASLSSRSPANRECRR